jgi:tetratricopeptide (TPR) repeat protein
MNYERFNDALACLETIVARERSHVAALTLKGDMHVHLQQFDAATESYKRAQGTRPGDTTIDQKMDALTAYLRGARELHKQQPLQALAWYSRAVELDPHNFD